MNCNFRGYLGREGVLEIMPLTRKLKDLIIQGVDALTIKDMAIEEGMKTLRTAALAKVQAGITSLDEAFRVIT